MASTAESGTTVQSCPESIFPLIECPFVTRKRDWLLVVDWS
jgi:hypothetical protein